MTNCCEGGESLEQYSVKPGLKKNPSANFFNGQFIVAHKFLKHF